MIQLRKGGKIIEVGYDKLGKSEVFLLGKTIATPTLPFLLPGHEGMG